ncbi:tRNA (5-methylaminomethyl-2-thiouridine)(34)-methyltransferase MnmD [Sphingobacterium deserti]|uniref:MnmC-like methyltransferase domain-containing protein n=1 Tax=Sphingobacterium deserti TaxID=1229276 RepID=A0A0B8T7W2_9SPHI|nr:tRNA (5-methylaminomethyl-2-thiouridine)(34)-methyltransferase MnmD [Sphingobacterium deserti]KGE13905.1 protein of unknown function DUF752 [Sphingobacterium deserti]
MEFVITGDGSNTLYHPEIGEHYHSKHGALQESRHVFIEMGLNHFLREENTNEVSVLEVGFGTGLNFLLTADEAIKKSLQLRYCGIEAYPLATDVIFATGYNQFVQPATWDAFLRQYSAALKEGVEFSAAVSLKIAHEKLISFQSHDTFDVLYFDAFAAIHQPEMWTDESLAHICSFLKPGGVFVTYAITGNLKRSMKALGFTVEKAPGAPGKREMLRATKVG